MKSLWVACLSLAILTLGSTLSQPVSAQTEPLPSGAGAEQPQRKSPGVRLARLVSRGVLAGVLLLVVGGAAVGGAAASKRKQRPGSR
jgi:hypothetical protein